MFFYFFGKQKNTVHSITALVARLPGAYKIPGSTKGEVMGLGSNRSGWLHTWRIERGKVLDQWQMMDVIL